MYPAGVEGEVQAVGMAVPAASLAALEAGVPVAGAKNGQALRGEQNARQRKRLRGIQLARVDGE